LAASPIAIELSRRRQAASVLWPRDRRVAEANGARNNDVVTEGLLPGAVCFSNAPISGPKGRMLLVGGGSSSMAIG